jgi:hypothetical protein
MVRISEGLWIGIETSIRSSLTSLFDKPYCELIQTSIIGCIKGVTTLDMLLVKDGGVLNAICAS